MPLTSLPQAIHLAQTLCAPLPPVSLPPLLAARLFLAEDVVAPRDLPGCDNSAMDGYAVRAGDTRGANRDRPARLRVVETIYAGHAPTRHLERGECARIFTGACLPSGADAVVRQEATRIPQGAKGEVEIVVQAERGDHIRRRGEELAKGGLVLLRGTRVDAAAVGVAASLGLTSLRVHPPPKVCVMTLGDELLPPGTDALPHQIHDSNGVMLAAMAAELNVQGPSLRRVPDVREVLTRELSEALSTHDVVITAGGASVGDKDLVKDVLRSLGAELRVAGVAIKPGKPMGLARVQGKPVVILPGNPGAAMVGFDQLARPVLLALQGVLEERRRVRARLLTVQKKGPPMTGVLSACVERRGGRTVARIRPQGAGQLLQNVGMEGWALLPPGRGELQPGERVDVALLRDPQFVPVDAVPAMGIAGWSGAGKTTLLEKLLALLKARGLRVAVIKHSSHPHPEETKHGSDTERFLAAGAASAELLSAIQTQRTSPMERVRALRTSGRFDLVLVEGWKDGQLPKVEVWRPGLEETPLFRIHPNVRTLVTDADMSAYPDAPRTLRTDSFEDLSALCDLLVTPCP